MKDIKGTEEEVNPPSCTAGHFLSRDSRVGLVHAWLVGRGQGAAV